MHPIGRHRWKIFIQFDLNLDRPIRMLALGEHENLAHKRVQIHQDTRLAFGLEQGANAFAGCEIGID